MDELASRVNIARASTPLLIGDTFLSPSLLSLDSSWIMLNRRPYLRYQQFAYKFEVNLVTIEFLEGLKDTPSMSVR